MIKATYISEGTFTLMPEYDELIQYSFEKESFTCTADLLSEVDLIESCKDENFIQDEKDYKKERPYIHPIY